MKKIEILHHVVVYTLIIATNMIRILIPIQSLSDVVTNSSSELFCTIFSNTQLKDIYYLFDDLFGYMTDPDEGPTVRLVNKSDDDYYQEEEYDSFPDSWIEISLPYSSYDASSFYNAGIKAILKDKFPNSDYTLNFG